MRIDLARTVADAVLYEGYLLYPYRASSSKNQTRWQFGVLGPVGAEAAVLGEASTMSMQCLLAGRPADPARFVLHLRFLHLQLREVRDATGQAVAELSDGAGTTWLTWDEAVEQELTFDLSAADVAAGTTLAVHVDGSEEVEDLPGGLGHIVRTRWPLTAQITVGSQPVEGCTRLDVGLDNLHDAAIETTADATRRSLIGTHVIIEAHDAGFVSLVEPPDDATAAAAATCSQQRCWPVLGGESGDTDLLLGLPIILYDYPEIADESPGALYDATEIDEILTLRVLTMTDEEKAEARATDPRAREIIDRCDEMTPETLQQMHGALRNPHGGGAGPWAADPHGGGAGPWAAEDAGPSAAAAEDPLASVMPPDPEWPGLNGAAWAGERPDVRDLEPPTFSTEGQPWWDPEADASVDPETDAVTIDGVSVSKGSLVRVHPNRRADAHDIFFADQVARVTAVLSDVDGGSHVAVVLVDDPASDMHEWYGRYFYFAPDELEPLAESQSRKESRS